MPPGTEHRHPADPSRTRLLRPGAGAERLQAAKDRSNIPRLQIGGIFVLERVAATRHATAQTACAR